MLRKLGKNGDWIALYYHSEAVYFSVVRKEVLLDIFEWMISLERLLHSIYDHKISQPTCILIYDSSILSFGFYKPNQPKTGYRKSREKYENPENATFNFFQEHGMVMT